MKTILLGVIAMSFLGLPGCRSIYHKLKTGDHDDPKRRVEITTEKILQIQPGVTTSEDLDRIFDRQDGNRWTYARPFWITWEGKKYRIDGMRTYVNIVAAAPVETPNMVVYSWKERRYVTPYLYKGIVQFVLITHDVRESNDQVMIGPLQNYDPKLLELDQMNGLGCDREIYDVVSLGRKPFDPEEFDKYCRPLIIEEEK